ncbi:MAG: non-contractile tail sheath protein [Bryobacteraceae bacterium]
MSEQIYKLSPHRDLQCYFYMPSAIAAMSGATADGFTLSGTWRQQFDWAVVEWNRDNVFEHPALRYLPDGDLSGLQLTYQETRTNCIPFESSLYPTVDWPSLRIWADDASANEQIYYVSLMEHATPVAGSHEPAQATMTIRGTVTAGNVICICMPTSSQSGYAEQHYSYALTASDTLATAAAALANTMSTQSLGWTATSNDASITLTWAGSLGANGNRITVYGTVSAASTVFWADPVVTLSGGAFPATYQITLNFGSLTGYTQPASVSGQTAVPIPTSNIRKLRWTWAPDVQPGSFTRTPFTVSIANWVVTGTGRQYVVAGPGSRRIEDSNPSVAYSGAWATDTPGNYSGGTIRHTSTAGAACSITYSEAAAHQLYLGSRRLASGASAKAAIDGRPAGQFDLALPGEDVLVRLSLGNVPAGSHTVTFTHNGPDGNLAYFDFLEIAYPSGDLPDFSNNQQLALATDWDTYHSQSLPAERTAWIVQKLGFTGRVNHYAGALWFYDLVLPGHVYNSATVTFTQASGEVTGNLILSIDSAAVEHLNLPWDTAGTVAQAFANLLNNGYTQVWAAASGDQLTITQRALTPWPGQPDAAPQLTLSISASPDSPISGTISSDVLSGGAPGAPYDATVDPSLLAETGYWRTDLTATLNQAADDWSAAYFKALAGYRIDVVTSFSTELKNADPNAGSGLAQRRIDGSPVIVATPAVMTNFSPICTQFWTSIYLAMAGLQQAAGLMPYLQFGEVQWWYYPWNRSSTETPVSMPFYDSYTMQQFQAKYGVVMQTIPDENADPSQYPNEAAFLPTLIGAHTAAIHAAVGSQFSDCRFEVLYPTDTNNTALNRLVNYPAEDWTPQTLNCLKTESFSFTNANNLDLSAYSMGVSAAKGFSNAQRSHLVGIGNAQTAWGKEADLAQSQGMQPVVLFALDQYCLIGYPPPPFVKSTRSDRQG